MLSQFLNNRSTQSGPERWLSGCKDTLNKFLDLDANTLAALGNKSPEKWEGLAIGPKLNDSCDLDR